jgi:hypothetical protein
MNGFCDELKHGRRFYDEMGALKYSHGKHPFYNQLYAFKRGSRVFRKLLCGKKNLYLSTQTKSDYLKRLVSIYAFFIDRIQDLLDDYPDYVCLSYYMILRLVLRHRHLYPHVKDIIMKVRPTIPQPICQFIIYEYYRFAFVHGVKPMGMVERRQHIFDDLCICAPLLISSCFHSSFGRTPSDIIVICKK